MSSNKLIDEIIKRYPEVFQALEDYDKTHKLRKIYNRKRLNITIDENVLRDFKEYSKRESLNISRFIEKKMCEKLNS